jgi:hypothetical protein
VGGNNGVALPTIDNSRLASLFNPACASQEKYITHIQSRVTLTPHLEMVSCLFIENVTR